MSRTLSLGVNFDALSFGIDIDFQEIQEVIDGLSARAQESRDAEADGLAGPTPQRYFICCPHCEADASFLGSTELPDRKVRMCLRCKSFFEVT